MADLSKTLATLLSELNGSSSDIQASAIVSSEGLLMAAAINQKLDDDRLAAMTNAMLAQAARSMRELQRGRLRLVLIKGAEGYVLIQQAGQQAALTVLLKKTARLGLVFLYCQRYAIKIAASGIAKPNTRIGLVYLGKRNN